LAVFSYRIQRLKFAEGILGYKKGSRLNDCHLDLV
jgi:hypothetical protein